MLTPDEARRWACSERAKMRWSGRQAQREKASWIAGRQRGRTGEGSSEGGRGGRRTWAKGRGQGRWRPCYRREGARRSRKWPCRVGWTVECPGASRTCGCRLESEGSPVETTGQARRRSVNAAPSPSTLFQHHSHRLSQKRRGDQRLEGHESVGRGRRHGLGDSSAGSTVGSQRT